MIEVKGKIQYNQEGINAWVDGVEKSLKNQIEMSDSQTHVQFDRYWVQFNDVIAKYEYGKKDFEN